MLSQRCRERRVLERFSQIDTRRQEFPPQLDFVAGQIQFGDSPAGDMSQKSLAGFYHAAVDLLEDADLGRYVRVRVSLERDQLRYGAHHRSRGVSNSVTNGIGYENGLRFSFGVTAEKNVVKGKSGVYHRPVINQRPETVEQSIGRIKLEAVKIIQGVNQVYLG